MQELGSPRNADELPLSTVIESMLGSGIGSLPAQPLGLMQVGSLPAIQNEKSPVSKSPFDSRFGASSWIVSTAVSWVPSVQRPLGLLSVRLTVSSPSPGVASSIRSTATSIDDAPS